MANVFAVKSGNWSDTTVWNTGALPTAADDVYSNNFTVTVDVSPTVLSVRNTSASGIAAGGTYSLLSGVSVSATGTGFVCGGNGFIVFNAASPASASLTGSFNPGNQLNALVNSGTGTLTITSSTTITSGNYHGSNGTFRNSSSGTLNIVGSLIAGNFSGTASTGYVINSSGGTVNITGNVTASNAGPACLNSGNGVFNITGNITNSGFFSTAQACVAALNTSSGIMIITGSSVPAISGQYVYENASSGILYHYGSDTAGTNGASIGPGSINQVTYLSGPFIGTAQGVVANNALRWRWVPSVGSSYMTVPNSTATGYKNLFTADNTSSASGQPATTNVRSGTVYGPNNELTGTCAVPAAGSVALGVPVDNTTGTAVLSLSDVQTASTNALTAASAVTLNQPITSLTTPNSIGERLKNSATVATVSQQISDVFSSRQ